MPEASTVQILEKKVLKSTNNTLWSQNTSQLLLKTLLIGALLIVGNTTVRAQIGVCSTWGWNSDGQIGNGNHNNSLVPFKVVSPTRVVQVAHSGISSYIRRSNGTVWAWGANDVGQLGLGTTTPSSSPTQIPALLKVGDLSASAYHALAVKGDGTVWAWGANDSGQLGDGTNNTALSPIQVVGVTNAVKVACGGFHSLLLKSDGTVWAWGYNGFGELGNNTEDSSNIPVQTSGLTNVVQVSAGGFHSMALKSDGSVWAWGSNQAGQFGDGTYSSSDIPVQVPNLNNVIQIATGGYHSLFLKSDGSVWSAGFNTSGQLGDGTTIDSPTPQAVTGLSNIVQICAGESHSLALKSDGTVWAWGINTEGEIGDGTTNQSSVPVQVQGLTLQTMISVGSQHNLSVQATQIQAKLSAANPVTRYGQPIKLSIRMKDGNSGLPLIQELVTITLDGAVIGTVTTDSAGKASLIVPNPDDYDVGNHAIGATFAGGRLFLAATAAGTLTVNPDNTALASGNLSAYLGATAYLKGSLLSASDKSPLTNQLLSFSIDGAVVGEATTDGLGKAKVAFLADEPLSIGFHILAVDYGGDSNNSPSHWQGKLTVLRTPTKLSGFHATVQAGVTIPFKVKLVRTTDKKPLVNQTLHWVIGGVEIGSATTNSSGIAQLNYTIPSDMAVGDYPVTLSFGGDLNYLPISSSASVLTIKP